MHDPKKCAVTISRHVSKKVICSIPVAKFSRARTVLDHYSRIIKRCSSIGALGTCMSAADVEEDRI